MNILQDTVDVLRKKITKEKYYRKACRFFAIGNKKYIYGEKGFDEIISLGYNCEISARLEDIFDYKFNHFLYSWSYENNRDLFLKSLQNLSDNFGESEYTILSWGMFTNKKYNIDFHSKYKKFEIINSDKTYTDKLPLAIEEVKKRTTYLANKLNKIFCENKNILFIIKLKYTNIDDDIKYILTLDKILKSKLKSGKYTLLVVTSKENYPNKFYKILSTVENGTLNIRRVKSFAKDENALSTGDIYGWIKLITHYLNT